MCRRALGLVQNKRISLLNSKWNLEHQLYLRYWSLGTATTFQTKSLHIFFYKAAI